jgi:hypothetical protein
MQPASTQPEPVVLSPKGAAGFLGVDIKTVHALLARGLPHQRLSTRIIRIRRDDLLAYGRVKS